MKWFKRQSLRFFTIYDIISIVTEVNTNKIRRQLVFFAQHQIFFDGKDYYSNIKNGLKFISEKHIDYIFIHEQHKIMYNWFCFDWKNTMSTTRVFSVSVLVLESVAPVKTFTNAYQKSYLVYDDIILLHEHSMLCMFKQENRMHISTISVHYQVSLAYLNKNIKEH